MKANRIMAAASSAALLGALAACGGGGSSTNNSPEPTPSSAAANSMSGTVAVGTSLVGAQLTVVDSTGKTAIATSGSNGSYNVSIMGLTAPFVIVATDPSGVSGTLYSVVASTATNNDAPITANVTPLTTAVAALLTSSGNPFTLTQAGGLSVVTSSSVTTAITTLDTAIASILSQNQLSASSFDPIGGAFTPNQTGADAVIDSVAVTPSTTGSGFQITSLADPNTAIPLNQETTVTTALKSPSQPANYLTALLSQLSQCMTAMQANANATSSACSSAIDANYLHDGNSNFGRGNTLFQAGTTLTGAKTVAFLPAGTLPNINNPSALVYFLVTDANGTPNITSDIVQQLPNGNWDVAGDQEQFNIHIASFLGRVQFTDAADSNNDRYESGINILIPAAVTVPDPAAIDPAVSTTPGLVAVDGSLPIGSALVQGSGLPANGVYMVGPNAGLGPYLTFPLKSVTAPPGSLRTSPLWPDVGMSSQYKWSWASLSGSSNAFVPSMPDYTPAPVDVSTIRQFALYTVTLYDYSGNQIGTPQSVINIAPNVNAAVGTGVSWQTIGSDVISNLLTPGGAGASTASPNAPANLTAVIDWSAPSANLAYPGSWASVNSQGAGEFLNGVETYQAQPYDAMNVTAPTVNGTSYSTTVSRYVDQLTGISNANAESAVQVQLGWQADGQYYSNIWQYNN
jgi:hypothetical protein